MKNFDERENWSTVEMFYAPNVPEPPESEEMGSSNHANVFNRRFQALVDRTAWLKSQLVKGAISDLITIAELAKGKLLAVDTTGRLMAVDQRCGYAVGDVKYTTLKVETNPFTDEYGYMWYHPNGTVLNNAVGAYEKLFKAWWMTTRYVITEGRGATAQDDWNAGKNLEFPNCTDRIIVTAENGLIGATKEGIGLMTNPTMELPLVTMNLLIFTGFRQ